MTPAIEKYKNDIFSLEVAIMQLRARKESLRSLPKTESSKAQIARVTAEIKEARMQIATSKRLLSFERKAYSESKKQKGVSK